jgi:hypothetical protein
MKEQVTERFLSLKVPGCLGRPIEWTRSERTIRPRSGRFDLRSYIRVFRGQVSRNSCFLPKVKFPRCLATGEFSLQLRSVKWKVSEKWMCMKESSHVVGDVPPKPCPCGYIDSSI